MSIRDTIPAGSVSAEILGKVGNAVISRRGWNVQVKRWAFPSVFGPDGREYIFSDGCLVPRQETRAHGMKIPVGDLVQKHWFDRYQGFNINQPLLPEQNYIFVYNVTSAACRVECGIAFNVAASPVIEVLEKGVHVFDTPNEYRSIDCSEADIGSTIEGEGVLIARNVQFCDHYDTPVGPLFNCYMLPETFNQMRKRLGDDSGGISLDRIAALKNVYGHDGANIIKNAHDCLLAAMMDISELGKWQLPPPEILAGVSVIDGRCAYNLGDDGGQPLKKIFDQLNFPGARYPSLPVFEGGCSKPDIVVLDSCDKKVWKTGYDWWLYRAKNPDAVLVRFAPA